MYRKEDSQDQFLIFEWPKEFIIFVDFERSTEPDNQIATSNNYSLLRINTYVWSKISGLKPLLSTVLLFCRRLMKYN